MQDDVVRRLRALAESVGVYLRDEAMTALEIVDRLEPALRGLVSNEQSLRERVGVATMHLEQSARLRLTCDAKSARISVGKAYKALTD